jgi:hypothetical protein
VPPVVEPGDPPEPQPARAIAVRTGRKLSLESVIGGRSSAVPVSFP